MNTFRYLKALAIDEVQSSLNSEMSARACQSFGKSLQHLLRVRRSNVPQVSKWMVSSSVTPQRCMSSSSGNVIVEREDATGVAVVKMNRKPVNSLNLEMLTELSLTLEKLEGDKSCPGIILTSANPGVFSAGLDIMEMYQPEEARLREFWRSVQEVWLRLYGSGLITMAAINGHAPAGGCLISLCCDYRVMAAPSFTIGLNETQLGIIAPFWFIDTMLNTVGHRQAEYCLQLGRMVTSEEALKINMVDELGDISQVQEKAREEMDKWLKIPGLARQLTKSLMRGPYLKKLQAKREEDINTFVNFVTKDSVQKVMGIYIENLKKRKN